MSNVNTVVSRLLHIGLANIVVGAIYLVDALRDVIGTRSIGTEAAYIHM